MTTTLFANPLSGHAWKVRQALVLLGIPHRYRFVDLVADRQDRRPDFVAVSPFGEVPVLVRDREVLAQSNAILLALARETGRLAGPGAHFLERWLFWEANRIGFSVANLRWELRFQKRRDAAVIKMLRDRMTADLVRLEAELEGKPFVGGTDLSMVDIACSAYLQFRDELELDLDDYPRISRWMSTLRAVPGWEHAHDLLDQDRADP